MFKNKRIHLPAYPADNENFNYEALGSNTPPTHIEIRKRNSTPDQNIDEDSSTGKSLKDRERSARIISI
jgi:hypothetical protein